MKRLKRQATGLQESQGNLLTMIDEAISGMRVIKAFAAEKFRQDQFLKESNFFYNLMNTVERRRVLWW